MDLQSVATREILLADFTLERFLFGVIHLVEYENVLCTKLQSTRCTLMAHGLRIAFPMPAKEYLCGVSIVTYRTFR